MRVLFWLILRRGGADRAIDCREVRSNGGPMRCGCEVGTIRPGMLADFAILAQHPGDVTPGEIDQIPLIGTVIGGELVPVLERLEEGK